MEPTSAIRITTVTSQQRPSRDLKLLLLRGDASSVWRYRRVTPAIAAVQLHGPPRLTGSPRMPTHTERLRGCLLSQLETLKTRTHGRTTPTATIPTASTIPVRLGMH